MKARASTIGSILVPLEQVVVDISEFLSGPARYKFHELRRGVLREDARLGRRPWLVILWCSSYDIDGLTESIRLVASFDDFSAAKLAAAAEGAQIEL